MWATSVIPALGKQRLENGEEVSLDYIALHRLQKQTKATNKDK